MVGIVLRGMHGDAVLLGIVDLLIGEVRCAVLVDAVPDVRAGFSPLGLDDRDDRVAEAGIHLGASGAVVLGVGVLG